MAPGGFEFLSPTRSDSNQIWNCQIRCSPKNNWCISSRIRRADWHIVPIESTHIQHRLGYPSTGHSPSYNLTFRQQFSSEFGVYVAPALPSTENIDGISSTSTSIGLSHGSVSSSSLADSPLTELHNSSQTNNSKHSFNGTAFQYCITRPLSLVSSHCYPTVTLTFHLLTPQFNAFIPVHCIINVSLV